MNPFVLLMAGAIACAGLHLDWPWFTAWVICWAIDFCIYELPFLMDDDEDLTGGRHA